MKTIIFCLFVVSSSAFALENLYPVFSGAVQKALTEQRSKIRAEQFVYSAPASFYQEEANVPSSCQASLNKSICAKRTDWDRLGTASLISTVPSSQLLNSLNIPANSDTYVFIVPGIFGEFIEQPAFGEVFSRASAFKTEWEQKLVQNRRITDTQELLARVTRANPTGVAQVPLKDLFKVGSIDQIKVAVFNATPMSLETLGDSAERATIFNRRLEKFFQVIGHVPKNIIFIGYSRGTTFGLDMLSQAQAQNKPWVGNVRAMVGLGGVVFGSTLADDAVYNRDSLNYKQVASIRELLAHLLPYPANATLQQKAAIDMANREARMKFYAAMARLHSQAASFDISKFSLDNVKSMLPNTSPTAVVEMAIGLAQKYGVTTGMLNPLSEDASNCVLRFKRLVEATVMGVTQLSSPFRIQWWKRHQVPLNVKYLAISGLIDSTESNYFRRSVGFDPKSADDQMLYKNWSDFGKADFTYTQPNTTIHFTGTHMNDSQVDVVSSQFWPDVIAGLNPANRGIKTGSLGVLATHHWGLALPYVNKYSVKVNGKDQVVLNGSPREAVLKAIVMTVLH